MRIWFPVVACFALSACAPTAPEASDNNPPPPREIQTQKIASPASVGSTVLPAAPSHLIPAKVAEPILPSSYHTLTWKGVSISAVCYDDREFELRVADQPNGCGSLWMNAKSAAIAHRGIAAINGGFFTPEGKPLGLLVADGSKRGSLNTSSLGAGFYSSSPAGSALFRRSSSTDPTLNARQLLQSGPMLVAEDTVINGLSNDKMRRRSFLAWNGGHHWVMGQAGPTTLHALANSLSDLPIGNIRIYAALNLDGGTSSDLWVGAKIPNGNRSHRSLFNKPVRNYLVLTAR
ncbi:MAG: phosphodiester glycosidase family protein [Akkermansiaceae bacterium]